MGTRNVLAKARDELARVDEKLGPLTRKRLKLQRAVRALERAAHPGAVRDDTIGDRIDVILARGPRRVCDILDALDQDGGVPVGGGSRGNRYATVLVTLRRDPRFLRIEQGVYGRAPAARVEGRRGGRSGAGEGAR